MDVKFARWLSVITEKEINNKSIIENACSEEDEIQMAMTALQKQSEDKLIRQAYQRRRDEIYFYNKERADDMRLLEQEQKKTEQAERRAEQERQKTEQAERRAEQAEKEIARLTKENEELRTGQKA